MAIDVTPIIAATVSSLSAATAALFAWARHLAAEQVKMLEQRVKEQEEQIHELNGKLTVAEDGRREDAQTYARGLINLSHKFSQNLRELVRWLKATRIR